MSWLNINKKKKNKDGIYEFLVLILSRWSGEGNLWVKLLFVYSIDVFVFLKQ